MKNWKFFFLGCIIIVNTAFSSPKIIDQLAAKVNNDVILESDVIDILNHIKHSANLNKQKLSNDLILKRQILNRLIIEKIIIQIANRININVNDEQLDMIIKNIAEQNNISINELQRSLIYSGINYTSYCNQIRKNIIISKVLNHEIPKRFTILSQEIESINNQLNTRISENTEFNLSEILIYLPEHPTNIQINKAKSLACFLSEKIKKIDDPEKLANTYSNHTYDIHGVRIGWKNIEEIPSLFIKYLKNAKKDDIIGPIRSGAGFHILKINDMFNLNHKKIIKEIRARHILLHTSEVMTNQQAKLILLNITKQIKSGQITFSDAAKKISEDFYSSKNGGDIGWGSENAFDSVFQNALINLRKNQISNPVHSSFGWHLIQIVDTREVDNISIYNKDRAYSLLFNRRFNEEEKIWIQEQYAHTYIKIFNNNAK